MYENQECADSVPGNGCFTGEVDFIHQVQNVGFTCHEISQVYSSAINLALGGSRNSCPNDIFDFVVKKEVTFCSGKRYDFGFELGIFTSAGTAPVTSTITINLPEGITDSAPIPPKPLTPVPTKAPIKAPTKAPVLLPTPMAPAPAPVTTTVTAPAKMCEDHPTQLWLTFTSRSCTESNNEQFSVGRRRGLGQKSKYGYRASTNSGKGIRRGLKHRSTGSGKGSKKSKKDDQKKPSSNTKPDDNEDGGEGVVVDTNIEYSCGDYEIFGSDPKVMISITSINEEVLYWSGSNICEGTDIVIGDGISKIASEIKIKIYADSGTKGTKLHQQIIMHTACVTKAMSLGDIFGAIEVTGMRNGVQGLLGK